MLRQNCRAAQQCRAGRTERALRFEQMESRELLAVVEGPVPGDEFQVNTTFANWQVLPQAAMTAGGDAVVVWLDSSLGGPTPRVVAQRYNASGAAQGGEIIVSTNVDPLASAVNAKVAVSDSGEFVVVWTHLAALYGRVFNADGTARTGAFQVDDKVREYDVAMDADGDFGVVYWEAPDGFTAQHPGFETRIKLFDENAVIKGSDFALSPVGASGIFRPQIAMDADGDFVVPYLATTSSLYEGGFLFAQRFNAAGARQGSAIAVSPLESRFFDIDMNAAGDFAIAFTGNAQYHSWGMNAARFDAAGVLQTPIITFGDSALPYVALADDGDFVVAWTRSTSSDPDWIDIYAQRFNADATAQTAVFRVNQFTTLFQTNPHVAGSASGDFLVVWEDWEAQDGNLRGIFGRRFGVGMNDAATANADAYTLNENATLTVSANSGVLANDRDTDGDGSLSDFDNDGTPDVADADDDNDGVNDPLDGLVGRAEAELLTGPTHGTLYFQRDGSFVYAPADGYLGADSFSYRVIEPNGTFSNTATVSLTITSIAGRSSFSADNIILPSGVGAQTFPLWATFIPGPAGPYTPSYTVSNVSNPALFTVPPTVAADGTLSFQLAGVQTGRATFEVELNDGAGGTERQTFAVHAGKITGFGPVLESFTPNLYDLSLTWGDTDGQSIHITGARAGEVFLRGSLGDYRVLGVTNSLSLNDSFSSNGGGDTITIDNLFLAGRLHVNSTGGNDHLQIGLQGTVSAAQQIYIATGDGDNLLECLNVYGGADAQVQGSFGRDRFHFYDPAAPGVFVLSFSARQFTSISTTGGDDEVIMHYGFFPNSLSINVETGTNYLELFGSAISGLTSLVARSGTSTLICDTNYLPGGLSMHSAYGSSRVFLANSIIPADVTITLFDGGNRHALSNSVEVRNLEAGTVVIRGNDGTEGVDVRSSLLDELFADLGGGSDLLTLYGNLIESTLDLDGGADTDRLLDLGGDNPVSNSRRNWEVFG
jgi:hypothetical protein